MKRIILLSDGTGNAASGVWRTNVWRIFESLDLTGSNQVAIYDDGVGTSSFKPLAILGGAFGWGLKRNILDLYKFVCRNYQSSEDEIFGFGFSRGAFTMRMVVGLIISQGLVRYETEAQLTKRAKDAYRAFRRENFHTVLRVEKPFRWLRDLLIPNSYHKSENRTVERIRIHGVVGLGRRLRPAGGRDDARRQRMDMGAGAAGTAIVRSGPARLSRLGAG